MATATRKPTADRNVASMPSMVAVPPRAGNSKSSDQNLQAKLAAISKTQAMIELSLDGIIETANETFLSVVDYRLDEIKGQHHSMFVDPVEAQGREYHLFWDRLRRGESQTAEFRRFGKGGREIWIQGSYTPLLDTKGNPYKVIK